MSKLVELKRITDGGLEAKPLAAGGYEGETPSRWAIYLKFFEKIALLMLFGLHFTRCQSHLKEQNFLDLKAS